MTCEKDSLESQKSECVNTLAEMDEINVEMKLEINCCSGEIFIERVVHYS